MKIKFTTDLIYGPSQFFYRRGQVVDFPDGLATELIKRKKAQKVTQGKKRGKRA